MKFDIDIENFPTRLIALMDEKHFTCAGLARAIEVDKNRIYAWRKGTCYPQMFYLARMCVVFDVSADYLMMGKDYEK